MQKIQVTGENSYIGNFFCDYMKAVSQHTVTKISVRGESWKLMDFSMYDVIFHVAGIAHSDTKRISEKQKKLYYKVNTKLTIALAKKAKAEGVKQFIFISSAIVYGSSTPVGKTKVITKNTPVSPANCYGDSKVKAEAGLEKLKDDTFHVVILRPPMIYGAGSKGNYPVLATLARKLPVFPKIKNQRSMCYIGNLVEFVRVVIENKESGIFWPCNKEYSNTSELVKMIAAVHKKKVFLVPGFEWIFKLTGAIRKQNGIVNKAFGSLAYEENLGDYQQEYRKYSLEESIRQTEKN